MKKVWFGIAVIGISGSLVSLAQTFVPQRIKAAGQIVYCTEVGYPPFEFFPESSKDPTGFDIEVGNEIAKRLSVKAKWENVGFDGIIASLQSKKCDAIIAGLGATPKRREQVDFVLYLQNNRAIMVAKGNPKKVTGYDALCGLVVGAQIGSANYDDMLKIVEKCKNDGKPEMKLSSFKDNAALKLALLTNQIDAYNTAAANAANDVLESPEQLEVAAVSEAVNYIGIALRKNDAGIKIAIERIVKQMHKDGSMDKILKKWSLSAFRLKKI